MPNRTEGVEVYRVDDSQGWSLKEEPKGSFFDDKPMITDPRTGGVRNFTHYREGFYKPYHRHTCSHGIYVIDGKLRADDQIYGPGSFVWDPAGFVGGHGSAPGSDCKFLFISNTPFDIEFLDQKDVPEKQDLNWVTFSAFDAEGWKKKTPADEENVFYKPMVKDPSNGTSVFFVRYPAGHQMKEESHVFSIGIYVVRGKFTDTDETYGSGTFIWYPEGTATLPLKAGEETIILAVTNMDCGIEL